MLGPGKPEPWLVSKVSDGFRLFAECIHGVGVEGLGEDSATITYHSPTGTGPLDISIAIVRMEGFRQWRVRVAWTGAASVEHLDISGKCRGCGAEIADAKVTEQGSLVISHIG